MRTVDDAAIGVLLYGAQPFELPLGEAGRLLAGRGGY